jgi:predicted DNA-binding transcriptional regulator AlpA
MAGSVSPMYSHCPPSHNLVFGAWGLTAVGAVYDLGGYARVRHGGLWFWLRHQWGNWGMPTAKTVRLVEIAEILGMTHQRASVIARGANFPRPVGRQGQSRVWDRREVSAWRRSGGARSRGGSHGGRAPSQARWRTSEVRVLQQGAIGYRHRGDRRRDVVGDGRQRLQQKGDDVVGV